MPVTSIEELTRMKTAMDKARTEQARLEGQLADRMARLKELGHDTVESAEAALAELRDLIANLDDKVKRGIEELHTNYGL
jgi:predicted  nucleic acid-binding Zn-ribbon protein